ncbi:MAG: hydantoinase/oxoprolinase family protein [Deltaproteobacteria bacterium]
MGTKVGIDSGGTFTDAVALSASGELRIAKIPSTPADPAEATVAGFLAVAAGASDGELRHGTTVPTNALLERRGARTALVTNAGFADILEIGRQRRPDLYDASADRAEPLVPRARRFEVGGRIGPDGAELAPLDLGDLEARLDACAPEAVAISLLHSYANPQHEEAVAARLGAKYLVVRSSEVAGEFREYERTSTAVMHAWLGPGTARYFERLAAVPELPEALLVMRSSGGLGAVRDLARRPADALLSGPAAGALAAAAVAQSAGFPTAVGFDMGGTSTDVVLIRDGRPELRPLTLIDELPCLTPALAIHTVGAGGGSLARLDAGGALRVGPESAGALPGPVAYGRGGTQPTVTDANVALGRVRQLVGGRMAVDHVAAAAAVVGLGRGAAEAILAVVEANMERALREVTVERGVDPADVAIVAFGGAGALHAARLCRNIGARCVIVPPLAGLLSAVGLLAAPIRVDRAHTQINAGKYFDPSCFTGLVAEARESIAWAGPARLGRVADCRYVGQSHELAVALDEGEGAEILQARFHQAHEERNGYRRPEAAIEVVTLRVSAEVASDIAVEDVLQALPGSGRAGLRVGETRQGPLLLPEDEATTWVPEGFSVRLDAARNLILEQPRSGHA